MGNLVQELGERYIQDRFAQSMFFTPEGRPCYVDTNRGCDGARLPVVMVDGTPEHPETIKGHVPYEYFKDMNVLRLPELGWRMANQGRYLVHFRRNNRMNITHYKRGLTPANIERFISPATIFLQENDSLSEDHYLKLEVELLMIAKPAYVRFADGIEAMKRGELFSFCSSSTVAAIPDVDDGQAIYFNTRQVGKLDKKGKLTCNNKLLEKYLRDSL